MCAFSGAGYTIAAHTIVVSVRLTKRTPPSLTVKASIWLIHIKATLGLISPLKVRSAINSDKQLMPHEALMRHKFGGRYVLRSLDLQSYCQCKTMFLYVLTSPVWMCPQEPFKHCRSSCICIVTRHGSSQKDLCPTHKINHRGLIKFGCKVSIDPRAGYLAKKD